MWAIVMVQSDYMAAISVVAFRLMKWTEENCRRECEV